MRVQYARNTSLNVFSTELRNSVPLACHLMTCSLKTSRSSEDMPTVPATWICAYITPIFVIFFLQKPAAIHRFDMPTVHATWICTYVTTFFLFAKAGGDSKVWQRRRTPGWWWDDAPTSWGQRCSERIDYHVSAYRRCSLQNVFASLCSIPGFS